MRILKSLLILSSIIFSLASNAALPPLSQEDREAYSSNIITGVVVDMTMRAEAGYRSVDNIYTVTLASTSVEKGDDMSSLIKFSFWRAFSRPEGWCGPGGQYGMMKIGDTVRAYILKNDEDNYELIEPNGFDKL